MNLLDGKHAIVTGGGTGIGLACALEFSKEGATVTITGRREDKLTEAAESIQAATGGEVRIHAGNVADEDDVAAATAHAADAEGVVDIAVANAGTGTGAPFLLQSPESFRDLLEVNVIGAFLTMKHAGLTMRQTGGSIIAMSSIASVKRGRFRSMYSTTKAGLDAMVDVAADELGGFGIRVNSIRPGLVPSEVTSPITTQSNPIQDDYIRCAPMHRIATPEEIGRAAVFLAGPDSAFITGQHIAVDGGHTIRRAPDMELGMRAQLGESYGDYVVPGTGPMGNFWDSFFES